MLCAPTSPSKRRIAGHGPTPTRQSVTSSFAARTAPTTIGKRFGRAVQQATLPRLRFHDLRHTSAVIGLRELGEWPDETSARLGHASTAFTLDTYGHLLPARGRTVAAAFDRLLADRQEQAETAAK